MFKGPKIYHNPRCRKSREALNYLNECGYSVEIIKYFETKLTSKDISTLLNKINLKPIEITRKNEIIWKKKFSKMNLKEDELIDVLSENPSLIERPIVEYENSGVLARPIENLISFDQKVGGLNK